MERRTHIVIFWLTVISLLSISGCRAPAPQPTELRKGILWMFPGIFGDDTILAPARKGLRKSGYTGAIYSFRWQRPYALGTLWNLIDEKGNRERATVVAQEISAYGEAFPESPIDLIGYSGGAGMAVMVAEALPQDVQVRHIFLVQGAISPDYDLTRCLNHVEGRLVNFYSRWDWAFLGLGTSVFGTMDRVRASAAGKTGFNLEAAVPDPELHLKVVQIPWTLADIKKLHLSTHYGMFSYFWHRDVVGPELLADDALSW